eukprot:scaffold5302_cov161-Prasinococcus_capsulatus_cf.AAC.1
MDGPQHVWVGVHRLSSRALLAASVTAHLGVAGADLVHTLDREAAIDRYASSLCAGGCDGDATGGCASSGGEGRALAAGRADAAAAVQSR